MSVAVLPANEELIRLVHSRKLKKFRSKPLARPERYLDRMLQAMKLVPLPLVTTPSEEVKEYVSELGLADARRFEVLRVVN